MNSWMTCFALGAKCESFGDSGDTVAPICGVPACAVPVSMLAAARVPNPEPIRCKASRRDTGGSGLRCGMSGSGKDSDVRGGGLGQDQVRVDESTNVHEFICAQHDLAVLLPTVGSGVLCRLRGEELVGEHQFLVGWGAAI